MGIAERRERERDARRGTLLDAARILLLERGFIGTTTKLIAERCELSEATLFFYFRSKEEILMSLLFEGIDFWGRGLEKLGALDLPREQMLARIWKYFLEVRDEPPEYFFLSTYLSHPRATADLAEDVKAELVRRSGENFARLTGLLEKALGGANPRLAAELLWASFLGLITLRDARLNLGSRAHPAERELSAVLHTLLNGLLETGDTGGKR